VSENELPVVVVGAGPVGLAAAAHLLERGLTPLVLEAGPSAGTGVRACNSPFTTTEARINLRVTDDAIASTTPFRSRVDGRWPTLARCSVQQAHHPMVTQPSSRRVIPRETIPASTPA
jgi:glycine/D-amino acid oxidase-like deaminating enzyme